MIYWTVLPLTLAISLVYAASRHEHWSRILPHAGRLFVTILGLLLVVTLALLGINTLV